MGELLRGLPERAATSSQKVSSPKPKERRADEIQSKVGIRKLLRRDDNHKRDEWIVIQNVFPGIFICKVVV